MSLLLGIESSCDETAASVVKDGCSVLSSIVSSQDELHLEFGGVVPEIASRAHLERILPVIQKAIQVADVSLEEDNIAELKQAVLNGDWNLVLMLILKVGICIFAVPFPICVCSGAAASWASQHFICVWSFFRRLWF